MDPSAVRTVVTMTCGAGSGLAVATAAVLVGAAVMTEPDRAGEVAGVLVGPLPLVRSPADAGADAELHAVIRHRPAAAMTTAAQPEVRNRSIRPIVHDLHEANLKRLYAGGRSRVQRG